MQILVIPLVWQSSKMTSFPVGWWRHLRLSATTHSLDMFCTRFRTPASTNQLLWSYCRWTEWTKRSRWSRLVSVQWQRAGELNSMLVDRSVISRHSEIPLKEKKRRNWLKQQQSHVQCHNTVLWVLFADESGWQVTLPVGMWSMLQHEKSEAWQYRANRETIYRSHHCCNLLA